MTALRLFKPPGKEELFYKYAVAYTFYVPDISIFKLIAFLSLWREI